VLTLVGRARRRLFHNELFSQGANAAAAVLIFLILLLLVGTYFLDTRWVVPVAVLAAGAAWYRALRCRPSPYAAARIVDQRLALADATSTAVYFQQNAPSYTSPAIRQFQRECADRVAQSVDVRRAVPYAMPRRVYLLAVLILVAGVLMALRYGLAGRLDLQAPLARLLRQQFGWSRHTDTARNLRRQRPPVPEVQDANGAREDDADQAPGPQPDAGANDGSVASSDADSEKGDARGDTRKDGSRASQSADGGQDAQAESNPSPGGDNSAQDGGKADRKQAAGKLSASNPGQSSSLVDKAKDLFQNLLSSLKPPASAANQQPNGDPNQPGKGTPKPRNDSQGQPQNSGQQGESADGQPGGQGENPEDSPDAGKGANDSGQDNKKAGSGAGNQDGDKRLKQAEDLAAMGKITQILGQRSVNLTGEATAEVQSTSQQLRTPYAPRAAAHGQSGGEVNRDEIPVAIEPYVQQYFEQVRKQAPPVKKQ